MSRASVNPRCAMCNPNGERLGYCSRHVLEILNKPRTTKDPFGILTDDEYDLLYATAVELANQRRRAEVEARQWPMA